MMFSIAEETKIRLTLNKIRAKMPNEFTSLYEVFDLKNKEKISQLKSAQGVGTIRYLQGSISVLEGILSVMEYISEGS